MANVVETVDLVKEFDGLVAVNKISLAILLLLSSLRR